MNVELQRPDLINLCIAIAANTSGDLSKNKFKDAFKMINFINGQHYRLNPAWLSEATDETLFAFYQYHSSTIKLL